MSVDKTAAPALWWHPWHGVIAESSTGGRYFALGMGQGPVVALDELPDGAVAYVSPVEV